MKSNREKMNMNEQKTDPEIISALRRNLEECEQEENEFAAGLETLRENLELAERATDEARRELKRALKERGGDA